VLEEARLEDVGSGLAPVSDGWFVVNLRHAAWLTNDAFGARCVFEGGTPVLRGRPDLPAHKFAQVGLTLQVLHPGQPSGLYHAETNQEGFLVLAGECLLLVEGEERQLRAWDFVHCPPGTAHSFVGAGDGPYAIFMAGARTREKDTAYPHSDLPPSQVYDPFPDWQPQRPEPKGMPAGYPPLGWSSTREG
jgi:quercetin dioxygenase-like cupin family protein